MTREQFLRCLALTESNDNPNAPLGDNGRSLGRFQVHPDWVFDYSHRFSVFPNLNETWDAFIIRLVSEFYLRNNLYTPVVIAMHFHIGHFVQQGSKDWDVQYAERFEKYELEV